MSAPPPWTPEQEVSATQARSLIEAQFPELRGQAVEPLSAGWDNTAFLVGGRLVFRFPRRTIAVDLIETEARVLPVIASSLPVPVPVHRWVGRPDQGYPWPFAGYEILPGRPAAQVGLDEAQRNALAPVLGRFLNQLHRTDTGGLDLPGDTIARADQERRIPMTLGRIEQLKQRGLIADSAPLRSLIEALPKRA